MINVLQSLLSLHLKIVRTPNNNRNENRQQTTQNIVNATLYQYGKATNQTLQLTFPANDSIIHELVTPDVVLYIHVWPILLIAMLCFVSTLAWRSYNRMVHRTRQVVAPPSDVLIEARYKIYSRQRVMTAASLLLWKPLIQQQSIEDLDDFGDEQYTTALSSRGVPI
ncbi:hypothetical protein C6P45_001622 [Maudiozyma exigua]|uniref:Uncharacterized protein n=1 Tax=Maudiozyma exigua TaxID=34358 RepID=A0A9P6W0B2_MAUEX|nr:hypothetical protein C6P45_001622 [Kazachstania exigua]